MSPANNPTRRVVTVFGATGAQGGGLARAILDDPRRQFGVRAVTRKPDSPAAQALASAGAEVVAADLDDADSVRRAMQGAHGAFCVTNFWEHFSPEKELAQADTMAKAASETGVAHVIWSTLDDTREYVTPGTTMPVLMGKYNVPHFDAKGEANRAFTARATPTTLLYTSFYWLKVHEIPDVGPDGKGKAIANLVQMQPGEKTAAMLPIQEFDATHFIVMGTRRGSIKKTELASFSNPRAGGIIAMGIEEDDEVMAVQLSDGASQIFIGTRLGMAIRFNETDVRSMGRTAYGVRGIQLRGGDQVVAMEVVQPGGTLLTVTQKGYAKRTDLEEYRVQSRGGLGLKNLEITEKNGQVVGIAQVHENEALLVITQQGKILRTAAADIRTIGRATQGVRVMDLGEDDSVVSVALVERDEEVVASGAEEA